MAIDYDPHAIIARLKKKGRASANELGTDSATMKLLKDAKVVREDGKISLGGRGRPPTAWILVEGASLDKLPEIQEPKKRDGTVGITQGQIDKVVTEVVSDDCQCGLVPGVSLREIYFLGAGCTSGRWVCRSLDAVRRRLNVTHLPAHGNADYLHWLKERVEADYDADQPGYVITTGARKLEWNTDERGLPLPNEVMKVCNIGQTDTEVTQV